MRDAAEIGPLGPVSDDHRLFAELKTRLFDDASMFDQFQAKAIDGIWFWDLDDRAHEWMSPRIWETLGYEPAERPHSPEAYADIVHPDDLAVANAAVERHLQDPKTAFDQVVRVRKACGETAWIRCRGFAIADATGRLNRMLGVHSDVSKIFQMKQALEDAEAKQRRAEQRLWTAIAAIPDALAIYDREDRLVICNEQYRQLYTESAHAITEGATFEEILRAGLANGQYPEAEGREEAWLAERLHRHRNPAGPIEQELPGNRFLQIHEVETPHGDIVGLRVDVTELRRRQHQLEEYAAAMKTAADELEQQAQEDLLTGLANRRLLMKTLPDRFDEWVSVSGGVALLLIDLDLFKNVNDKLGHAAGDYVLKSVGRILTDETRDCDIAARIGGDEFVVLTPLPADTRGLARFAQRLIDRIGAPIDYSGSEIRVGASVGVAICRDTETAYDALLQQADDALYRAKTDGRNRVTFA